MLETVDRRVAGLCRRRPPSASPPVALGHLGHSGRRRGSVRRAVQTVVARGHGRDRDAVSVEQRRDALQHLQALRAGQPADEAHRADQRDAVCRGPSPARGGFSSSASAPKAGEAATAPRPCSWPSVQDGCSGRTRSNRSPSSTCHGGGSASSFLHVPQQRQPAAGADHAGELGDRRRPVEPGRIRRRRRPRRRRRRGAAAPPPSRRAPRRPDRRAQALEQPRQRLDRDHVEPGRGQRARGLLARADVGDTRARRQPEAACGGATASAETCGILGSRRRPPRSRTRAGAAHARKVGPPPVRPGARRAPAGPGRGSGA